MRPEVRDTAIRDIGCICCLREGEVTLASKHHLLTTGLHGNGKRRGEQFTVGLCPWHHQGVPFDGFTLARMRGIFGPSYHHHAKAFRDRYGDDESLLAVQNELIGRWRESFVGVRP